MRKRVGALAAAVLALSAWTPAIYAQTLAASIAGSVRDSQRLALPGARLTLLGKTGSIAATSDSRGEYRFPAVDPGQYELRAESSGFKPRRETGIALSIGERLTVDFLLELAPLTEGLEVTGETPVVDVRSSSTPVELSHDLLFQLPLTGINLFNMDRLPNLFPGINRGSAFGASEIGNGLLLDGLDTTAPNDGSTFLQFDFNLLESVQAQGPGATAEYGAFTGAVINAVSRSGSNRPAGLFEIRRSGDGLASDNVSPELAAQNAALANPAVTKALLDLTAQISGPIAKDKLFFLIDAEREKDESDPVGTNSILDNLSQRLNAKLTWQPGSADRLVATGQYDVRRWHRQFGAPELRDDRVLSEWSWNLRWRRILGARSVLEAQYAGWSGDFDLKPTQLAPSHGDVTGSRSGSTGFFVAYQARREQANVSFSHYAEAFGKHDLKFGVEIARGRGRDRFSYVGGLYYYDYGGQPYLAYSYSYDVTARTERASAYAQDSWAVGPRLTLNLGGRLDSYRGKGATDAVYRARGVAPRVGLAWDVTNDRRTVLRASYGRYYETLPNSYFKAALPGIDDRILYDVTGPTHVEIFRQGAVLARVDPGIRQPHTDELTAGFARALRKDIGVSITAIWRRGRDTVDQILPDARFVTTSVPNLLTGAPLTVYRFDDPTIQSESAFITNMDDVAYLAPDGQRIAVAHAFRHYRGLMLVLTRRLEGRWQAQASYVLSKSDGTADNDYASNIGPSGKYVSANEALINANGRLSHDARHELKILGSYEIPKLELGINGMFQVLSGAPYTPLQVLPPAQGFAGQRVRLEPRGSRRGPATTVLDLRIEKVVRLKRGRLGFYADIANVFNAATATSVQDRVPSVQLPGASTPVLFGTPTSILPARQATLAVRFSF